MVNRYILDTNALIYFFSDIFEQENRLSTRATSIIEEGFNKYSNIVLIIPNIVFIEIFAKWNKTEEFIAKFYYEVFQKILNSERIEIKPIEKEVLENLMKIRGTLDNHEINDKIILACAMSLESPLITTDPKIIEYVNCNKIIPGILN